METQGTTQLQIKFVQAVWEVATMIVDLPTDIDPSDASAVDEWVEDTLTDHMEHAYIEIDGNVESLDSDTTWSITGPVA